MVKILTAGNEKDQALAKMKQVTQLGDRAANVLDNLVTELEQFSAWTFSEFAIHNDTTTPDGLVADGDMAGLTAQFEARRARIQALMDRMNAIASIAGAGVLPADIPANAAAFMAAIGYNHAAYSATFIK